MEKLLKKISAFQQGEKLTREQMKNVTGGITIPTCFRCCPDDPCSTFRHACPLIPCGEI